MGGKIHSHRVAVVPIRIAGNFVIIRACMCQDTYVQRRLPFLVSKPCMRALGAVIDTNDYTCIFKNLGNATSRLSETRGTYRLKLTDFPTDRREWRLPQPHSDVGFFAKVGAREFFIYQYDLNGEEAYSVKHFHVDDEDKVEEQKQHSFHIIDRPVFQDQVSKDNISQEHTGLSTRGNVSQGSESVAEKDSARPIVGNISQDPELVSEKVPGSSPTIDNGADQDLEDQDDCLGDNEQGKEDDDHTEPDKYTEDEVRDEDHCPHSVKLKKVKDNSKRVLRRRTRNLLLKALKENDVTDRGVSFHLSHEPERQPSRDRIVWEVFSVPRLTKEGGKYGFKGKAFDIKNGWDLTVKQDQEMLWEDFVKRKPDVLSITVPCAPWSTIQNMSKDKGDPKAKEEKMKKAIEMLRFAVKLADAQLSEGRHVIIEHPIGSKMWSERHMKQLLARYACYESKFDQCELGLKFMHQALRKRTRIVTSMIDLAKALNAKQCSGKHDHRVILGQVNGINISRASQTWTPKMCRYIMKHCQKHFQHKDRVQEVQVYYEEKFRAWMAENDDIPIIDRAKYKSFPQPIRSAVARLHAALGHPSKSALLRTMKLAKCSPQAIEFAKHYQCATCESHRAARKQRVVKLPDAFMFNDVVSLDCFKMDQCLINQRPTDLWYLNIVDRATSLQKCIRIASQTPSVVWKAFEEHWILAWFGCPKSIVTDGHGSFRDVFADNLERWSCRTYRTSSEAPMAK